MKALTAKLLFVEGADDEMVIKKLLKRRKIEYPDFSIHAKGSKSNLWEPFKVAIKANNHDIVGIVLDADESMQQSWEAVTKVLKRYDAYKTPDTPNPKGTILEDEEGDLPKIGVWIMPNNQLSGTLETFMATLIPEKDELLPKAEKVVNEIIKNEQRRFPLNQKPKAIMHTWLAWQKDPGLRLGTAITHRVADKNYVLQDKKASDFIAWIQRLFK